MLNIDCLLKNTDYINGVRDYIQYIGSEFAENGKDASFHAVFKHIREQGLEVDIETAGELYTGSLPTEQYDHFTKREEVEKIAGAEFDNTIHNLINGSTKEGEQEIKNLSPKKQLAKKIIETFNSKHIVDARTKSILKTIYDIYAKSMDRFAAESEKPTESAPRNYADIAKEGHDKMAIGYRDNETGLINNLNDLHEGVKAELNDALAKLEKEDPVKAEQFKKHIESFKDATYAAALSKTEIKQVVEGALADNGFGKKDKKGNVELDMKKLAGDTTSTSIQKLRDNVIEALTKDGKFSKETAEIIAKDFQRQFIETKARSLEILKKEQASKKKTWEPPVRKEEIKIDDVVAEQVKRWEAYIQHENMSGEPLVISKKTAADALKHTIIAAGLSRETTLGKPTLDINKLSNHIKSPADIRQIAKDYFADQRNADNSPKYSPDKINRLANAMDGMFTEMFNKVREHVEGKAKAIESTWEPNANEYTPLTPSETIIKRLKEWSQYKSITGKQDAPLKFTQNEAQRLTGEVLKNSEKYGKENSDGKKSIDWLKTAEDRPAAQDLDALIKDHLINNEGFTPRDAAEVANSLTRDYHGLLDKAITEHASAILEQKAKAIEREKPEQKTAIQRLAELNALGIFDKEHEKLLYHFLDVDAANTEDLQTLKEISGLAGQLSNELGGNDYLGSFLFKNADRKISAIIERNKNDQARLSGIMRAVGHLYDITNMGLISNPYNLIENNWSGLKAVIGANAEVSKQFGITKGNFFKDRKLWAAVWKDVAIGGVEAGDAGEKFAHLGNFADNLNSVNLKKNPGKALKTLAILIPRALLNASDAANKAVLAKNGMMLSMHQAMMAQGWSQEAATQHIATALYGDKEIAKSRIDAADLIDKYGAQFGVSQSKYGRERAITRLSNDMMIANLNFAADPNLPPESQMVSRDMIQAAMGSGLHAAAVSLGHEANNFLSKRISEGKKRARREEQELFDAAKNTENQADQNRLYNQYAAQKFKSNVYYNGILRMQSGAANWMVLRTDALGWRLATKYGEGSALQTELVFKNKQELERTMKERINAQRKITRSLTGLSEGTLGLIALATYGLFRKKDDDEPGDEGVFMSAAKGISKSQMLNRSVMKFAPEMVQLYYLGLAHKENGLTESSAAAVINYAKNVMNANPAFTVNGHIAEAALDVKRNKTDKALGQVGAIYGSLTDVPFYKTGKGYYQIVHHLVTGQEIQNKYPKNNTLVDGAFGGGLIQDIASNVFSDETLRNWGMEDWIDSGSSASGSY